MTTLKFPHFYSYEEQINTLKEHENYRIKCLPDDIWEDVGWQQSSTEGASKFTPELTERVMRREETCPSCFDTGTYYVIQRGNQPETSGLFRKKYVHCRCQVIQHMWKIFKKEIPGRYVNNSLINLKPNPLCCLSEDSQAAEIASIKAYPEDCRVLLGKPGTGKTTLAYVLFQDAMWRDRDAFWANGFTPEFTQNRWIWYVDFDALVVENQLKKTEDISAGAERLPEQYVTPRKIKAAAEAGRRPVLVIEEVDKTKMNAVRINLLFQLINEIDKANGQFVITSNKSMVELTTLFTQSEEIKTTGDALIRRLGSANCHDYFTLYPEGA